MINEIGVAVLVVIAVVAAFQVLTVVRAKRMRGRPIDQLPPAAAALLDGRGDVLVYFYSPTCAPCRAMTPAVDAVAADHPRRIVKVDVSTQPDAAVAFGLRATPTLVRVRGGRIDNVYLGAKDRAWIEALLS